MVSPGQQHSSKQVSCSHKHSIHFGDVHADFLTAAGPIWSDYSEDTWFIDIWATRESLLCGFVFVKCIPIFWLPRATRKWSPSFEGRSVLVRTTVSGPILWSMSITCGVIPQVLCSISQTKVYAALSETHWVLTSRASSCVWIFLPVNSLRTKKQKFQICFTVWLFNFPHKMHLFNR